MLKLELITMLLLASSASWTQTRGQASLWLTTADKSALFEQQKEPLLFTSAHSEATAIEVDEMQRFQTMDGFGFALTGGSAQHLVRMEPAARAAILKELFGTAGGGIGISYLRVSIGASDLNDHVFSYDDLAAGETDPQMLRFNLGPDRDDVIPVLKQILAINPKIKILGSPWSPPTWMKTNQNAKGGNLKPEWYAAYATYFVKYIQAMKAAGIRIDAITVQNEPLNAGNTPSVQLFAPDEAIFIRDFLGPKFRAARMDTKIIAFDHNCDTPEYPIAILDDPQAARFIDGSGFHLYRGKIDAMSDVHKAHPTKNLYFTEQMVTGSVEGRPTVNVAGPVQRILIGATRNWSRNVILWNLAADPQNKPHTDSGGCTMCQGAITIDGSKVSRNVAYYAIAHASKFVRPGAVRIASNSVEGLPNVAFRSPRGGIVLIVVNTGQATRSFEIRQHGKSLAATLKAGSVATYLW
ncbi:MAG TPA: glycoside hydrolase family 30 beta sandwich domain-containing protein [Candidatus Sulfopaludibacter sp.]|jgi:glucosylceramidase|nr:glycoside hydrolase family 30 beta sandwich domain-containing protein [Candidatus Sulfopaludibacter sp.]